ncbi:MAG: NfeD family protein [Thermomicrobiales bacterium]
MSPQLAFVTTALSDLRAIPLPAQLQAEGPFAAAVAALADPNIAYFLLVLGFLGLFLELSSPGTSIPGAIGVVSLILAGIGLSQLPFDWRGALLILVAFLLFFADIFLPSLGLLTLTGLVLLVAGSYVLFDEAQGAAVSRPLIWAIAAGIVALFVVIGGFAISVWRRKPATGREGLIDAVGTVRQALNPDGIVFVSGELWQATAPGDTAAATPPIAERVPVTVTGMDGLRLFVRRATESEADAAGVAVVGDIRPVAPQEAGLSLADSP